MDRFDREGLEEDVADQLMRLAARVAELEERVARLEGLPATGRASTGASQATAPSAGGSGGEELVEAMIQALGQLGEADAGAIRQQLIKNGLPSSLARSDVNKQLYAHKERFQVARQEGMKPIWKLA
ncbi:MAG TPA: hypothetical protein VH186_21310 [Chloroflexia bacterium]|nr:hypothetical protein [Chloroflexia bacterium]